MQPPILRTLFLSDMHLGALGCRADLMLAFLLQNRAETYYLVGDVLDLWHPLIPHWGRAQQAVIDHLHQRHAEGARLIYIRGNHDPVPERADERRRLPIVAQDNAVHEAADGRRFLVLHGDEADTRPLRWHLMTRVGSHLDDLLRRADRALALALGRSESHKRSVIEWLLSGVVRVYGLRRGHERALAHLARSQGLDGVICGHFHLPGLHDRHGAIYANCGDWLDSFTALGEDHGGVIRLLGGRAALAPQSALPGALAEV